MQIPAQPIDIPANGSLTSLSAGNQNGMGYLGTQVPIKKLSIIIPSYNEAKTITKVLDRINQVRLINNIEKEVIVVNDCSKDNTEQLIEEYISRNTELTIKYLKYIKHEINQGKGAAIHTGIRYVTGDYVLIQDADLEYAPKDYNLLLEPILEGHADIVYGSRFMGGNPHRILFFWHTLGNKLLTLISNILTNLNLTDAHTCYKMLKASTIRELSLKEKRFAFDAELNVKISRIPNLRIYEVGISYYGRTFADGKKIRLKDAVRTVYSLLKYSLTDRKPYVILKTETVS